MNATTSQSESNTDELEGLGKRLDEIEAEVIEEASSGMSDRTRRLERQRELIAVTHRLSVIRIEAQRERKAKEANWLKLENRLDETT